MVRKTNQRVKLINDLSLHPLMRAACNVFASPSTSQPEKISHHCPCGRVETLTQQHLADCDRIGFLKQAMQLQHVDFTMFTQITEGDIISELNREDLLGLNDELGCVERWIRS